MGTQLPVDEVTTPTQRQTKSYPVEYDSLQAFRIQYLQMIASFWADREFWENSYNAYIDQHRDEPTAALKWLAMNWGDDVVVPWNIELSLDFNHGPHWDPRAGYGRLGWILDKQAKFTIYLPVEALRSVPDKHKARALAAFMRDHTSLLKAGTHTEERDLSDRPSDVRALHTSGPESPHPQMRIAVDSQGPASLPTMGDFREFDGVCTRILALSAKDDSKFWDKLHHPHPPLDVKEVLSDCLEYTLPWNMDLHFDNDDNAKWDGSRWTLRPNGLELFVPHKPKHASKSMKSPTKSPGEIEMIALASYNETGADHPLTCP